ncbi:hypothetical protein [Immundisolibacter cernigliae]|uniref:hypothetical protein n=1 Tax=Immundisolibacter cernigliae TaxID=1810504 RepID=UPI001F25429F|nr:hypothetical protein [Immundisolibacter cernigliae]
MGREFIEIQPEVVAVILLTLAAGWQRACAAEDVNANAGEVLMTERLRDGMRGVLRNSPWKLIVLPGTESRSKASVVLPDGRTDIPLMLIEVFLRTQEHDPHAVIECKRIAGSDTHLCREYVVEGMDRFVREKYGENHAIGFMVGYVLSGSPSESADGVNAYLRRVSRSVDRLAPSDISDGTWQSLHARSKPSMPIRLHHAFLGFAGTPASRT